MLVIFDCDGVLVDSEVLVAEVFASGLESLGVSISVEDCLRRFKGRSMASSMDELLELVGGPIPKSFFYQVQRQTYARFEQDLQAIDGVDAVLQGLKERGIADCVASNGRHEKMRQSLTKAELWAHFEGRLYSAEDVAEPKPAPDVFLSAASDQGCWVQDCVVIEDSNSGVAAAVAAQMTVLFFGTSDQLEQQWKDRGVVSFERMERLLPLLDDWRKNNGRSL